MEDRDADRKRMGECWRGEMERSPAQKESAKAMIDRGRESRAACLISPRGVVV